MLVMENAQVLSMCAMQLPSKKIESELETAWQIGLFDDPCSLSIAAYIIFKQRRLKFFSNYPCILPLGCFIRPITHSKSEPISCSRNRISQILIESLWNTSIDAGKNARTKSTFMIKLTVKSESYFSLKPKGVITRIYFRCLAFAGRMWGDLQHL